MVKPGTPQDGTAPRLTVPSLPEGRWFRECCRHRKLLVPVWCRFSRAFGSIPSHTVHGRRLLFRVFARGVVVLGRTLNQRVAGSIPARPTRFFHYLRCVTAPATAVCYHFATISSRTARDRSLGHAPVEQRDAGPWLRSEGAPVGVDRDLDARVPHLLLHVLREFLRGEGAPERVTEVVRRARALPCERSGRRHGARCARRAACRLVRGRASGRAAVRAPALPA